MSLVSGRKVVAAAGTAEQLSRPSVAIRQITIMAETDNTRAVVVGGPDVVAALATRRGVPLAAGASLTLYSEYGTDELSDLWIDAEVSGEGVTFLYMTGP